MYALKMYCPKCGHRGENKVIQTVPPDTTYYYIETTDMLTSIAGYPDFRYRSRKCNNCHKEFITIESNKQFIDLLIREIKRLKDIEKSSIEDKAQIEAFKTKFNNISDIINNWP